ncbi:MAG: fimbria major subunit, partial [Muribaculaceae bacterium]|nr:fimbria major subunit [Muribaculaceae bacterium]
MSYLKVLFTGLIISLLSIFLSSCAEAELNDSPLEEDVVATQSFVQVNIGNTDGFSSRVDSDIFQYGTPAENRIDDIAFFFFDDKGNPFNITSASLRSSSNCVLPITLSSSSALIMLGREISKDRFPSRVVAIANLRGNYSRLSGLPIGELVKQTHGLSAADGDSFVMTSSTYIDDRNEKVFWSSLSIDNVCSSPSEAERNPVRIYLERLAAKVTVTLSGKVLNGDSYKVASHTVLDKDGNSTAKDFYAKIHGWDLNATAQGCYLIKNIDEKNVPFSGWNNSAGHRSYWAVNPVNVSLKKNFSWGTLSRSIGKSAYCYENTRQSEIKTNFQDAVTDATKVILKAQITDDNGSPQDIISFSGTLYYAEDFKTLVARYADPASGNPEKVKFLRGEIDGALHKVSTYYGDKKLDQFDNIRYWENGICYYVANLRHDYSDTGQPVYGVVRNHEYRLDVSSILGLGTPGGPSEHPSPEN